MRSGCQVFVTLHESQGFATPALCLGLGWDGDWYANTLLCCCEGEGLSAFTGGSVKWWRHQLVEWPALWASIAQCILCHHSSKCQAVSASEEAPSSEAKP